MQLPPPDAILGSVNKIFEECNFVKRSQNKHDAKRFKIKQNTKHVQNKVLKTNTKIILETSIKTHSEHNLKAKHLQNNLLTHNSKAFTFAEVLIALVIIGVIAAITVPTLIQKYQDQALKSALKKNYSVLKSALDKYQVENGERLLANDLGTIRLKPILIKYLNVMTDCGNGWNDAKACIPNWGSGNASEKNSKVYKNYNNTNYIALSLFDDGQFILNDGSIIMINLDTTGKFISVDVNGYQKKPNRLGKDLFMFQLMNNGELLPMGAKNTKYYSESNDYCSNTSTNSLNGAGCTAKVLRD